MGNNADVEKILKENVKLIDRYIEKYVPREYTEDSLLFKISPPRYEVDLEALNKTVAEPIWRLLDSGGKRWRPALFLLVCEALGGNPKKFLDFAIIPEIVHNGTLMADDVEDSSEFRRGKPCTHKLFGIDIAINASQLMYFLPMTVLSEKKKKLPDERARGVYEIYVQEMTNLSLGQATDIAWHRGLTSAYGVTEERYLQMCAYKTGTLARMAAKMAAVLAGADADAVEKVGIFAESIGVAFQIQDDILDLVGEEFAKGKGGLGMDITEGKLTLMVINAIQKADQADKKELTRILGLHTEEETSRKKAIAIIRKYGAIEHARNFASKIVQDSWDEVDKVLPPSEAKDKLRTFAEYLIQRQI